MADDNPSAMEWKDYIPRGVNNNKTTCDIQGRYTHVVLAGVYGIHGTMPLEIAMLTELKSVAIRSSNLSAPLASLIPTELLQLTNMTNIDFQYNYFVSGTIPTIVGSIGQLERLKIGRNRVTGTLPKELGLATNLKYLVCALCLCVLHVGYRRCG